MGLLQASQLEVEVGPHLCRKLVSNRRQAGDHTPCPSTACALGAEGMAPQTGWGLKPEVSSR